MTDNSIFTLTSTALKKLHTKHVFSQKPTGSLYQLTRSIRSKVTSKFQNKLFYKMHILELKEISISIIWSGPTNVLILTLDILTIYLIKIFKTLSVRGKKSQKVIIP